LPASNQNPHRAGLTILGVDPGGTVTGCGVIRREGSSSRMLACGVSRAREGEDTAAKLQRVFKFVGEQIELYRPDVLAVEDIFYGKNVQSLKVIGQVRGVIILAGALAGLEVCEYNPMEVKKAVVGRGDASKEQVQRMIALVLGLSAPPEPYDAADALAIALCHSHRGA
jgi:crossover junction endodeoxyribonuclease RuvC